MSEAEWLAERNKLLGKLRAERVIHADLKARMAVLEEELNALKRKQSLQATSAVEVELKQASAQVTPSVDTAREIIQRLESEFEVNALTFRGVRIWPWLRNGLIFYYGQGRGPLLSTAIEMPGTEPRSIHEADELYDTIALARRKHVRRPAGSAALRSIKQADVIFVARGDRRSVTIDGKAFQTETDPLIHRFENRASYLKIDLSPGAPEREEAQLYYPAVHANPSPYLRWLTTLDRAQAAVLGHPRDEIEHWRALQAQLPHLAGEYPPLPRDPIEMAERAALILYTARWFTDILERARPKLVLSVGHNVTAHGIFLACRRAGVTCADIQHGSGAIRSKNIKWYGWETVPEEGYEILPDYFWVWGSEAEQRIKSTTNNPHAHRPVIGGDAWLDVCAELIGSPAPAGKSSGLKVLVTLPPLSADPPPTQLVQAMAKGPKEWSWLIRLHPDDARNPSATSQLESTLLKAGVNNAEFARASSAPLPLLLGMADRHITLYSSVAIQATAFGLGTIFAHEKGTAFFSDLRGRAGMSFSTDTDEILALLQGPQISPEQLIVTGRPYAQSAFDELLRAANMRTLKAESAHPATFGGSSDR